MVAADASRAERKRTQITVAARALFLDNGFAGTTMDGVSARAGVSKQTLYSYFPSKSALVAAIIADDLGALRPLERDLPTISSVAELRAVLLRIAGESLAQLMAPDTQQLLRLVIGEAFRLPELRDVVREVLPSRYLHDVEALVRAADEAGLVRAPRPDLAARMYVGPLASFVTLDGLFRADGPRVPAEDTLAYLVDAFLTTIRADAAT